MCSAGSAAVNATCSAGGNLSGGGNGVGSACSTFILPGVAGNGGQAQCSVQFGASLSKCSSGAASDQSCSVASAGANNTDFCSVEQDANNNNWCTINQQTQSGKCSASVPPAVFAQCSVKGQQNQENPKVCRSNPTFNPF